MIGACGVEDRFFNAAFVSHVTLWGCWAPSESTVHWQHLHVVKQGARFARRRMKSTCTSTMCGETVRQLARQRLDHRGQHQQTKSRCVRHTRCSSTTHRQRGPQKRCSLTARSARRSWTFSGSMCRCDQSPDPSAASCLRSWACFRCTREHGGQIVARLRPFRSAKVKACER